MALFKGAAVTINNPTDAHRVLCTERASGNCLLRDRLELKNFTVEGKRTTIWIGDEVAPNTGTPHLQARF